MTQPPAPGTPLGAGFRQPAEWERHQSCWLAWPAHPEWWGKHLDGARREFAAFCGAIAAGEPGAECLEILVPDAERERAARSALHQVDARFHRIQYGDIWLRDTGPIFLTHSSGKTACARFGFNGWGEKYVYPHDDTVARDIAAASGLPEFVFNWVLEGGAVETDGEGTCLASRNCLFDPRRYPAQNEEQMKARLREALGISKVIWLDGALKNDHTDGHTDTLARFTAPAAVLCMEPAGPGDPNREILERVLQQLEGAIDAHGRRLSVSRVPSPGRVAGDEHDIMPASYLNFYIGNNSVAVPVYGSPQDDIAVRKIAALFPGRRVQGLSANHILEGGGAFHCITQPQPEGI